MQINWEKLIGAVICMGCLIFCPIGIANSIGRHLYDFWFGLFIAAFTVSVIFFARLNYND
jgi:hypothetical protein